MTSSPNLLASLVSRAMRVAASTARVLSTLETTAIDLSGIEDEGPSKNHIVKLAQDAARHSLSEDERENYARRLAEIATTSWLSHARRKRRTRPDVLALTCRILASDSAPESLAVARFAVILALRALYSVTYSSETLATLREVFDELEGRFQRQRARRFRRRPARYENFLLDLMFLMDRTRRTLAGPNLEAYYESFQRYSLGVAPGGVRIFDDTEDWPQIYGDIPDFPSLLTLAFGQPFAIEGLDEITGGLMPSLSGAEPATGGGLVSLVVGAPGSGKTTFCLTVASRMAALGSSVTYLTTEESDAAIRGKLAASASRGPASWWPELEVSESQVHAALDIQPLQSPTSLADIASALKGELSGLTRDPGNDLEVFLSLPRVLVVDSLTALLGVADTADHSGDLHGYLARRRHLGDTLNELRALGVCVILTASLGISNDEAIEYLVDNVFELRVSEVQAQAGGPSRTLNVTKTRLQASHTGQHVLHLSKDRGVVVCPSLATVLAEIKSRASIQSEPRMRGIIWAPSPERAAQMILPGIDRRLHAPVTVRRHAQTLLYGQGSAGKARLGLTICLEPKLATDDQMWPTYVETFNSRDDYVQQVAGRQLSSTRVLVISFLYGEEYYVSIVRDILAKRFKQPLHRVNRAVAERRHLAMLDLYPGLIDPETLIAKVRREIDVAKVAGRPYTAVMVDGVHNLVLQFPLLEREPLLWPCLYRLFRSEGLDTVATFTFFKVAGFGAPLPTDSRQGTAGGAEHLFFHLLVSSSDNSFVVEAPAEGELSHDLNWVRVKVGSSIDGYQGEPAGFWWDPREFAGVDPL